MTQLEVEESFRLALSDWDKHAVVTMPSEDDFAYAKFSLWRREFEAPLHEYDGEIWIGSEGFYHAPLSEIAIWQWIASQLDNWIIEKRFK